jgi:DNA/RNA-binding domain of Phe-tRNA-synthetase-like protein
MTILRVSDGVFERFPDVVLGVVVAHGIDNSGESGDVREQLRQEEAQIAGRFAGLQVSEHPQIAPWREAYRAFGAKPKDNPSSIENLVRRVLKGQPLPQINQLVDIYNTISLRFVVPAGGEDLDAIVGDVWLAFAGADEAPVRLLGEPEERPPRPGEVIYKDEVGAICRRWNWKEADRTKLTARTTRAFLVIEGLPPVGRALVEQAMGELADLIRTHCGGQVAATIVDRRQRQASLNQGGA